MTSTGIDRNVTMPENAVLTLLADRYRIVRKLGEGGMGSVWLAEDVKLESRKVAVKMLPAVLVNNRKAYAQVRREALTSLKLAHPNIATVRAFEEDKGNPFLVMDYIEGRSLADCLAEKGKLAEAEAVRILKPIAEALDYAHEQGVVHRDVKPDNVMIGTDGRPYVLDFGVAREVKEVMTHVTGKLSSGTLLYMSPDQLKGAEPKAAQDVYSFAAMAYECLKGETPFVRGQIEYQIEHCVPEMLPKEISIRESIAAGLAKTPEGRPKNCVGVLSGVSAGKIGDKDDQGQQDRRRIKRFVLYVALGLSVLAVAGAVTWFVFRPEVRPDVPLPPEPQPRLPLESPPQTVSAAVVSNEQPTVAACPVVRKAEVKPELPVRFEPLENPGDFQTLDLQFAAELEKVRGQTSDADRRRVMAEIRGDLDKGWWHRIALDTLFKADLENPLVLLGVGKKYRDWRTNDLQRARFYLTKAVDKGCQPAEKELAEVKNAIKVKPYFALVGTGNLDLIRRYLTSVSPQLDLRDNSGSSLLHNAAQFGTAEILDYFKSIGYDLRLANEKNGETVLYSSCRNTNACNSVACIRRLVAEGLDPKIENAKGGKYDWKFPIFHVRTVEAFDELLAHGAVPSVRSGNAKDSILHYYVRCGAKIPDALLERALKAVGDVDAENGDGETPLHVCMGVQNENSDAKAKFLLAHKANPNARIGGGYHAGLTPLQELSSHYRDKNSARFVRSMVDLLIRNGADINALSTNTTYKGSPLMIACKHGQTLELVRALCDHGADLSVRDDDGKTPLHVLAESPDDEMYPVAALINYLISRGLDKNARANDDKTPLHVAAGSSYSVGVRTLVSAGAEVDAFDDTHRTPLFLASRMIADYNKKARLVSIRTLLEAGANPLMIDKYGKSALDVVEDGDARSLLEAYVKKTTAVSARESRRDPDGMSSVDAMTRQDEGMKMLGLDFKSPFGEGQTVEVPPGSDLCEYALKRAGTLTFKLGAGDYTVGKDFDISRRKYRIVGVSPDATVVKCQRHLYPWNDGNMLVLENLSLVSSDRAAVSIGKYGEAAILNCKISGGSLDIGEKAKAVVCRTIVEDVTLNKKAVDVSRRACAYFSDVSVCAASEHALIGFDSVKLVIRNCDFSNAGSSGQVFRLNGDDAFVHIEESRIANGEIGLWVGGGEGACALKNVVFDGCAKFGVNGMSDMPTVEVDGCSFRNVLVDYCEPKKIRKTTVRLKADFFGGKSDAQVRSPESRQVRHAGQTRTVELPGGAPMTFCWCPATTSEEWKARSGGKDTFVMGGSENAELRTVIDGEHLVRLTKGFWIGQREVTQRQWKSVMKGNPSRFADDDRPVDTVTWFDCRDFVNVVNSQSPFCVSLPTEAQWEYACRAGSATSLPDNKVLRVLGLNNAPVLDELAWYAGNSTVGFTLNNGVDVGKFKNKQYEGRWAGTHPSGMKAVNGWGLYDVLGNVSEWCLDWSCVRNWYADKGTQDDPVGPGAGSRRSLRGGSFLGVPLFCCATYRNSAEPDARNCSFGFRLVLLDEKP